MNWANGIVALLLMGIATGLIAPSPCWGAVKIIPVPAFSTTANEGETYGILTAFLFTDERDEVYAIMAPFVVYNQVMGVKTAWQLFGYLEGDRDFGIKTSVSTKINREFKLEYRDPHWLEGRFSVEGAMAYFKEATSRFYGITQESRTEDETNFTHREFSVRMSFGYHLSPTINLSLTERMRDIEVQLGGVTDLPFIATLFPGLNGLGGGTVLAHRLSLTHERRDDKTTPTYGEYLSLFAEWGHVFYEGKTVPFSKYGFQAKGWFPVDDNRVIFVPNLQLQWMAGSDIPFFEQSTLGGEDTLRAYGLGRFVDDHFALLNFEARIRVARLRILGIMTEEEVAPFIDVGRVYGGLGRKFFSDWEANPGVGFRVLVRPNVVGRLDVAFGREGPTFFVGLDFPF